MVIITKRAVQNTQVSINKKAKRQTAFVAVYDNIKTFCTVHCREYLASPREKAF